MSPKTTNQITNITSPTTGSMLFVFAFARWPIEDKVARLESKIF